MTTKHRVTHDGQTFTRTSKSRTYTHAVLVPISLAARIAWAIEVAEFAWAQNQAYHQELAAGTSRFLGPREWETSEAQKATRAALDAEKVADSKAWLALGLDGHKAKAQAGALACWRESFPDQDTGWACVGWCGRLDLAQKLAAGHAGAIILPAVVA